MTGKSGRGAGPLAGIRVIELAGLGPGPYAAMMLADLGADVIRIDRTTGQPALAREFEVNGRSRRSVAVDMKSDAGRELVLKLVKSADALIEGMRPGVTERLNLGPAECLAVNPALVYGRMTGWGQDGPYAQMAGHDLNYLAITGGLHAIGYADRPPVPPLNVVGDYGGGATYLALGVLAGIMHARETGEGDVIDASIVDGVNLLMGVVRSYTAAGTWTDEREANMLDGGAPYYRVYRCADGKDIAIAAIEPQFWEELIERVGLAGDPMMAGRGSRQRWPAIRGRLAEHFATKTRDEWVRLTEGTDACLSPVLSFEESLHDKHQVSRRAFSTIDGVTQATPAPRFKRAEARVPETAPQKGEHTSEVLTELGFTPGEIDALRTSGVVV